MCTWVKGNRSFSTGRCHQTAARPNPPAEETVFGGSGKPLALLKAKACFVYFLAPSWFASGSTQNLSFVLKLYQYALS